MPRIKKKDPVKKARKKIDAANAADKSTAGRARQSSLKSKNTTQAIIERSKGTRSASSAKSIADMGLAPQTMIPKGALSEGTRMAKDFRERDPKTGMSPKSSRYQVPTEAKDKSLKGRTSGKGGNVGHGVRVKKAKYGMKYENGGKTSKTYNEQTVHYMKGEGGLKVSSEGLDRGGEGTKKYVKQKKKEFKHRDKAYLAKTKAGKAIHNTLKRKARRKAEEVGGKFQDSRKSDVPTTYASFGGGGRTNNPEEEKKKGSTTPSIGFSMDATSKKEQRQLDRAEARQEQKDKKGMIPARYRNRGQAGIEAYKADMAKKRSRKKAKGLGKIFGTKAARKAAQKARQASRAQNRRLHAKRKSGCQGAGCGAYSQNKY